MIKVFGPLRGNLWFFDIVVLDCVESKNYVFWYYLRHTKKITGTPIGYRVKVGKGKSCNSQMIVYFVLETLKL